MEFAPYIGVGFTNHPSKIDTKHNSLLIFFYVFASFELQIHHFGYSIGFEWAAGCCKFILGMS